MKKFIIPIILLFGCTKKVEDTQVTTNAYSLQFSIEQDQPTIYRIQKYEYSYWIKLMDVPDTSKTGDYNIDLQLYSKEKIRINAMQVHDTTSSVELVAE